jgi:RNA polymerase sigma factor (sigma-70 family)
MWADYQRLKSLPKTAKLHGRAAATIFSLFKRRGLITPAEKIPAEIAERIIEAYRQLASTYKVARVFKKTPMAIWEFLKRRGLTNARPKLKGRLVVYKGERFSPSAKGGYYRSTRMTTRQRGRNRLLHHIVWEDHHGPVPTGHIVKFKDGNRANCAIRNLECLSWAEARLKVRTGNGHTAFRAKRNALQGRLARAIAAGDDQETEKARVALEAVKPPKSRDLKKLSRLMLRRWRRRTPEQRAELIAKAQATKKARRQERFSQMPQYAIALLPERERELLRLYYVEGKSCHEIAPLLGTTRNYAQVLRARALKKLPALERVIDERVASVEKWIIKQAHQFAFRYRVDADDLIQEGRKAALDAAQKFDPSRGFKFLTYCSQGIKWRMDRFIRDHSQQVRVPAQKFHTHRLGFTSLDAPLSTDEGDGSAYGDVFCGVDESTTGALDFDDRRGVLEELIARLDQREQRVLRARFFDNRVLEDVGAEFGLTRERIRQIEQKALRRIRKMPQLQKLQAPNERMAA